MRPGTDTQRWERSRAAGGGSSALTSLPDPLEVFIGDMWVYLRQELATAKCRPLHVSIAGYALTPTPLMHAGSVLAAEAALVTRWLEFEPPLSDHWRSYVHDCAYAYVRFPIHNLSVYRTYIYERFKIQPECYPDCHTESLQRRPSLGYPLKHFAASVAHIVRSHTLQCLYVDALVSPADTANVVLHVFKHAAPEITMRLSAIEKRRDGGVAALNASRSAALSSALLITEAGSHGMDLVLNKRQRMAHSPSAVLTWNIHSGGKHNMSVQIWGSPQDKESHGTNASRCSGVFYRGLCTHGWREEMNRELRAG